MRAWASPCHLEEGAAAALVGVRSRCLEAFSRVRRTRSSRTKSSIAADRAWLCGRTRAHRPQPLPGKSTPPLPTPPACPRTRAPPCSSATCAPRSPTGSFRTARSRRRRLPPSFLRASGATRHPFPRRRGATRSQGTARWTSTAPFWCKTPTALPMAAHGAMLARRRIRHRAKTLPLRLRSPPRHRVARPTSTRIGGCRWP
mmetsp:Transcript_35563/g.111657  ORF Transcript_35563/g.111657 Transcript_35563/m.111657 type:complete len:201 (+) Transcript_35563:719-1321(+)